MERHIRKCAGCVFLFILASFCPTAAHAQVERNELGKRLQRFELQWDQASEAARVAAAAPMQDAVSSFFSLRLQRAAQGLDEAYWQAVGQTPSATGQAILAHRLAIEPLVVGAPPLSNHPVSDGSGSSDSGSSGSGSSGSDSSGSGSSDSDSSDSGSSASPSADSATKLKLQITAFYRAEEVPANAQVQFLLRPRATGLAIERPAPLPAPIPPLECAWSAAQQGIEWDVTTVPDGDYEIVTRVTVDGDSWTLLPSGWSRVAAWNDRLATLEADVDRWSDEASAPAAVPSWVLATWKEHRRVLQGLAQGEVPEIDYPAHRLLQDSEALVAAVTAAASSDGATDGAMDGATDGATDSATDSATDGAQTPATDPVTLWRGRATTADLWMTVAQGRRRVPLRLRAPAAWDRQTALPVLVLFHGAGGSENMFFETYGAGGAVQAGLERGWLVVATRQALTGLSLDAAQILDELGQVFPLDRQRIYFLGHSMGAGQVATQVGKHPDLPLAVAAIGGGGRPGNLAAAARVPWYVAAGSLDFGKGSARSLSQSLQRAGGKQVTYREFPDVEHMAIVQAALDETFQFFDKQKK